MATTGRSRAPVTDNNEIDALRREAIPVEDFDPALVRVGRPENRGGSQVMPTTYGDGLPLKFMLGPVTISNQLAKMANDHE